MIVVVIVVVIFAKQYLPCQTSGTRHMTVDANRGKINDSCEKD